MLIRKIKNALGRVLPMKWDGHGFRDLVDGQMVSYYRERVSGRRVMANSPISVFRVGTVG